VQAIGLVQNKALFVFRIKALLLPASTTLFCRSKQDIARVQSQDIVLAQKRNIVANLTE